MNKRYPDKIYIKDSCIYDGHTKLPASSFSANMYVSVNPWFDNVVENDAIYYHESQNEELQAKLDKVVEYYKKAMAENVCMDYELIKLLKEIQGSK